VEATVARVPLEKKISNASAVVDFLSMARKPANGATKKKSAAGICLPRLG
jgi:hypothetical protein